jgi:hypothetical protein
VVHSKLDLAVVRQPESLESQVSSAANDCAVAVEGSRGFGVGIAVEVEVVDSQQFDELICDMLNHTLGV